MCFSDSQKGNFHANTDTAFYSFVVFHLSSCIFSKDKNFFNRCVIVFSAVMSEVLLYRLKMNRKAILGDLEPDQVLDYLYQEDVLDSDKCGEVRDKGSRKKQAESLLSIVERDSTAIEKMINALESSSQRHLAAILKEELPDEVSLSKGK